MSARSFARRSRLLSATALVAAGVAALAPTAAFADTPAAAAPSDAKPLTATLSAPSTITPLVRGGSGESMTLSVTNNSDQAQPFHPAIVATATGSPLTMGTYTFNAAAIDAPPSWGGAFNGKVNGGYVLPQNAMADVPFNVPAHQTYTWSVSFGAEENFPADDTAVAFTLTNDANDSTNLGTVTFPIAEGATKPLTAKLSASAPITPLVRGGDAESMTLSVTNDSDLSLPFHPLVVATPTGSPLTMGSYTFSAAAVDAPPSWGSGYQGNVTGGYVLPQNAMASTPFDVPAHQTYTWTVSFGAENTLPADDTAVTFTLTDDANHSADLGTVSFPVAAAQTGSAPAKSTSAKGQSGTAAKPAAAAVALSAPVAAPVADTNTTTQANNTTATTPTTTTDTATTPQKLAYTGGGTDSTPLIAAGATLVALGAGAVVYSQRRRAAKI
ncbi:hypothetical protein [Kitasatospora viridis]|uniref:LPXTG-motif cell wall-anchored protein n=1 Tax=Kitasatospora viridis TaxID=281105 RepID=A0A561UHT2_9ACTN|nr:hypothetical protein [Kitasatospora viridis]TWF98917.1 hypothetical protein FHX73_112747 [Kitasatospora viridis]